MATESLVDDAIDIDEDEEFDDDELEVELGFVESVDNPHTLRREFFPQKVGGRPAWLHPKLPSPAELACQGCGKALTFLLQLYAPVVTDEEDQVTETFHRMLLVFVCRSGTCNSHPGSVKILRSQLPRANVYFPPDPAPVPAADLPVTQEGDEILPGIWMCRVCGLRAENHCGKCRQTHYCSRDCQTADWKEGHKPECPLLADLTSPASVTVKQTSLRWFKEFELIIEPEPTSKERSAPETMTSNEMKVLESFNKRRKQQEAHSVTTLRDGETAIDVANASTTSTVDDEEPWDEKDLQIDGAATRVADPILAAFEVRISCRPDQCVRYCFRDGAEPLWVGSADRNTQTPPNCGICGSQRRYEFQIMPQLLHFIQDDASADLDWGTIVIYTCSKSCTLGDDRQYAPEVYFRQSM